MNIFSALEIAASGLNAQRTRLNALSSNLANARTTQTAEGGPYKRQDPVFRAVPVADRFAALRNDPQGRSAFMVEVSEVRQDESAPQRVYDPGHPDADEAGYISLPNVNVVEEMVNLITASRAYEAGVTMSKSLRSLAQSALSIGG